MRKRSAGRNSQGHKGHDQVANRLLDQTGLSDSALIALLWNMVIFEPRAYNKHQREMMDERTAGFYDELARRRIRRVG